MLKIDEARTAFQHGGHSLLQEIIVATGIVKHVVRCHRALGEVLLDNGVTWQRISAGGAHDHVLAVAKR